MKQKRTLVVFVMILLTLMIFMPSYQAPYTNYPIENRDDCVVLINESFENNWPPDGWTNDEWLLDYYGEPYDGNHWAYSWSTDQLTTFPIEFRNNTTLTFWYRAESATHPIEGFEVYVNDTLVWSDDYSNHVDYEMVTVHLDSFSGLKTITFFTSIGDFYGMCLDMITVTTSHDIDVNQSVQDRGFPVRHSLDGDWGAAQNFTSSYDYLAYAEIYLRKFGTPEFNLTVELRENHPQGTLIDTLTFTPEEVPSSWEWFQLNFNDTSVETDTNLFIVIPPAPSGVTTSFGYEWGYAWGDQYWPGSFWFTRNGGGLWRDLPDVYEFTFRTYGYDYGLIGYWNFDEGTGSIAYDSSGNTNNGTIYGANWTNGVLGTALSFDGINDYIRIPDSDSISIGNQDHTISVWIKPFSLEYDSTILSKTYNGCNKEFLLSHRDDSEPNRFIDYKIENNCDDLDYVSTNNPTLNLNEWNHIAVTFNVDDFSTKIYHNGVQQDTIGSIDELPQMLGDDLTIGIYDNGNQLGNPFYGLMDEIRIFNRVLSDIEIMDLYQSLS